ncbi:MAG: GFA family protein [Deltaproteobacteria bacterium]|nr:GFA family protein [Deltaproteobacteria bacterium]
MVHGSCLCGDVAWEIDGPLQLMSHCHCSRCRKAHGAPFATYVAADVGAFRFVSGRDRIARWESSPGFFRCFCGRCGSVVPSDAFGSLVFVPAGCLDGDLGVRPEMHIFAASKAPWVELRDDLPRFDAYPPGFEAPVTLADLPSPVAYAGKPRGSCLCGGVAYVVEGEPLRWWMCHCSRCRKARGAACASNLFTSADGLRFLKGEDLAVPYKIPEAKYFMQVFCRRCGSPIPRIDRSRNFAIVPAGTLDDDPGTRPQAHIFVGSKAPWDTIADDVPQHAEYPPAS